MRDYSRTARLASKNRCALAITAKWRCARLGAKLDRKSIGQGSEVRIRGGQRLRGIEARIPGDLSSAAFFLCAAALFPGSQLTIPNLLMNPTRARLLDILMQMGLRISVTQLEEIHGELVGTLQVEGGAAEGCYDCRRGLGRADRRDSRAGGDRSLHGAGN